MNALIIDDERLARTELRRLLLKFPQLTIVGEAANAEQGLKQIADLHPDVVFLDVQMPGQTGFEMLERLDGTMPLVIFTTAYDEFAVRAFEHSALDYLMKPIDPARLESAIEKLRGHPRAPEQANRLAPQDKVFVRDGENCWFVELKQIRLLESEGNYTRIHFADAQPQLFRSLNAMEARLDSRSFFRANRRQIINLAWVDTIEPWFSSGLLVTLKGGAKVELSRRQAQDFREKMSL